MTNVLLFPRARTQSETIATAEGPSANHRAEILLFTGVRYERHAELDPQNAPPDTLGRDNTPRRRKTRRRA